MYAIVETDANGRMPKNPDDRCYLNHSCLNSMSFGSPDMAWATESRLEAEGMLSRVKKKHGSRNARIVQL